jgi:transcriptional regulator with XRE-family HTH domain
MDLKEIMAVNLRRLRHERRMTQEDLAHRAGISVRYLGAVERGDKSATVTVLGKLAEGLEVEPEALIRKVPR